MYAQKKPGFGATILQLLPASGASPVPEAVQQAAAVAFKNWVKYRWQPAEAPGVSQEEKDHIKAVLPDLMLVQPARVQAQLAEALAIISGHDFPDKWRGLLPDLVAKLNTDNYSTINGVLQTANTIFKRFRGQFPSQQLRLELRYVLDLFVAPLLEVFKKTNQRINTVRGQADALIPLLAASRWCNRIFYSLNSVELPDVIEDHLAEWMNEFHQLLPFEDPAVAAMDPDMPSPVDLMKAAICDNICLFMEKNEEEFQSYLPTFVADVWELLVHVGPGAGQDGLATVAMRFLMLVSRSVHSGLFSDPTTLQKIGERIILPNLRLRADDDELFDLNPVEYIRRDMEGNDSNTRRRSACELVRGLASRHEEAVTGLCSTYVGSMLQEYASNSAANWRAKDAAIALVIALAVRQKSAVHGATAVSGLVNIGEFFTMQIIPELQATGNRAQPVLQAAALKFLTTFRAQIPKATALALFPSLTSLLASDSYVVHSYAAHALERLLSVKDPDQSAPTRRSPRFQTSDIAPHLQGLLGGLFGALSQPESGENEYIMHAVLRVVAFAADTARPFVPTILSHLTATLQRVCQNPTHPGFNHYLFESIAALIRAAGGTDTKLDAATAASLEAALFPVFQIVLEQDIQEFSPYVFQLLAFMAECRPAPLSEPYLALLPALVSPVLWERPGNVPALVRLLQAYLSQASQEVVARNQLQAILGVFQRLIGMKSHDHEGFYIVNAVVEKLPPATLAPYLPNVWSLLFNRLQTIKTPKYVRGLAVFLALFISVHGPVVVAESIESVQRGVFGMLLEAVWVPAAATIAGRMERKLLVVALSRTLADCSTLQADAALPLWAKLLHTAVALCEEPSEAVEAAEAEYDADEDAFETPGYAAVYAQLHHAHKPEQDPAQNVKDARQFLAAALGRLTSAHRGRFAPVIQTLPSPDQAKLAKYCAAAGVTLV
eukprot:jgi/Chlat1/3450/Chrsp23S03829